MSSEETTEVPGSGVAKPTPRGVPAAFYGPPPREEDDDSGESRVAIGPRELALLAPEVAGLAERMPNQALREAYAELARGLEAGSVTGATIDTLQDLLAMGLQTGRFRRQHGPEGSMLLNRLYQKTPRGAEVVAAVAGVNQALGQLVGQVVEALSIRAATPGSYDLVIETDRCQMTIGIDPEGLRVISIEAGL